MFCSKGNELERINLRYKVDDLYCFLVRSAFGISLWMRRKQNPFIMSYVGNCGLSVLQ